jgi:RHS repeat-associated protein
LSQLQEFKTNGVWSSTYTTQRSYNLAGGVTTQTYPSGRTVAYSYDTAGRASGFTGNLGDGTQRSYSTEIVYSPLGGMTKEKFGTDTALYNKLFYNSRGQLSEIRESSSYTGPSDTTWNRGAIINHYSNGCWGMCGGSNSTTSMTDNNGNLKKQEVYVPLNDQLQNAPYTTWWQGYDYDNLNRLQRVHEYTGNPAVDWQQEYVYDRYGNRTIHQTNTWGAGINKKDFTANAANNNRLGVPSGQTGTMAYDPAGNLTTDSYSGAAVTRAYDAENRMTSETQANNNVAGVYTYNADGQRVRRKVSGVETWQVYGFGGELLAEYAASAAPASPQKEYGYRNGQLLITAIPATQSYVLQSFVMSKTLGAQRADSPGWTGFKMTVGAQPVTVNSLGRQCSSGNSLTHELRLIRVSDNSVVASTNVAMSGCTVGQFKYANLASPVTLSANTAYLLVSYEVGSDLFHDWTGTVLTTMSVATVNYGIYTTNGGVTWGPAGGTGNSYVPLDFQYQTPPSQPFVTGKTLAAQRSDSPGWTGFEMMVGAQPVTVTSLGRYCAGGNSLTHELRVIRTSDNSVVASTNVSMSGCAQGQTKYAVLASPVTLAANTAYLVVSYEVGSDNFYDWTGLVLTTTPVATVLHGIYTTNGGQTWGPAGGTGNSYVPVDFQYAAAGTAEVNWLVTDQLGTPRMMFDKTGALATTKRHDYLPFGEELSAGQGLRTTALGYGVADGVRQKFTQKERDIETGLDFFGARYYGSTQGRFTSADDFLNDTHVDDPSSWNLYVYVRNNPLKLVDPSGEEVYSTNLSDEEKKNLIEDWQKKTGYQNVYFDKNNKLVIDTKAGFQGGSAKARDQLSAAVNSTDTRFNLKSVDTTKVAFAEADKGTTFQDGKGNTLRTDYTVSLDFHDFKNAAGDDSAKEAYSVGIAAIHEFDHKLYTISDDPNGPTDPGPLERTYINPIRQELGLPERVFYSSRPVDAAFKNFYPGGGQQLNFQLNGKTKVIRWRNDLVGGKVKD